MKKLYLCLSLIIILLFAGCSQEAKRSLEEKIDSEIEYMESIIFTIANKQVKNEYLEDGIVNWDLVKNDAQKINNSWSTLVLDCTEVNVSNELLMQCSNDVNIFLMSMSDKNEGILISNLYSIYNDIINIKDAYSNDKNLVKNMKIKNYALKVYSDSYKFNYVDAQNSIIELENFYNELMNDSGYVEENNYHLNKLYILIQEYKSSIQSRNIDLIKIKYLDLVEKV